MVDIFFSSLRETFGGRPVGANIVLACLALIAGGGVFAWLRGAIRTMNEARDRFARFAHEHALTRDDVDLLRVVAAAAKSDPMSTASRIDLFEQGTASILHSAPTEELYARVHAMRKKLGFHALPDSFPLLTSRELRVGYKVELVGRSGTVVDVNEAYFVADVTGDVDVTAGVEIIVKALHVEEALYELKCTLLALDVAPIEAAPATTRVVLGHCESPVRVQHRDNVRVEVQGPVEIEPVAKWLFHGTEYIRGDLVDVSAGGMLADAPQALPRGAQVKLAFMLDDASFTHVTAAVVSCARNERGTYAVHLAFTNIYDKDKERLLAWVARETSRMGKRTAKRLETQPPIGTA